MNNLRTRKGKVNAEILRRSSDQTVLAACAAHTNAQKGCGRAPPGPQSHSPDVALVGAGALAWQDWTGRAFRWILRRGGATCCRKACGASDPRHGAGLKGLILADCAMVFSVGTPRTACTRGTSGCAPCARPRAAAGSQGDIPDCPQVHAQSVEGPDVNTCQ